ncbi:MAG: pirin family protein [Pseudomonadota bacterium]
MITLRRSPARRYVQRGRHETWSSFSPTASQEEPMAAFGHLVGFDELWLPLDGVETPHPREEGEVVAYVYKGALAQEDSTGRSGVVHAGEFQYCVINRGVRYKETNASRSGRAQVFRLSLRPTQVGLDSVREQRLFPAAQRRNVLCVVASPDRRRGSLRILQDAVVISSVLDPGHHLVHELLPGRSAWLHVVDGEAVLHDIVLTGGDGVGVTGEASVSFTAKESTEILLVDLGPVP